MKSLRLPSFLISFGLLVLIACQSNGSQNPAVTEPPAETTAKLSCTDSLHPEIPSGESIWENPDSLQHSFSTLVIGKDSIKWFTYEKDNAKPGYFTSVELTTMAIKDMDPAGLETTEGDIELTTGGKIHITGFFVRAIKEEKRFKSREYNCADQEHPYS